MFAVPAAVSLRHPVPLRTTHMCMCVIISVSSHSAFPAGHRARTREGTLRPLGRSTGMESE